MAAVIANAAEAGGTDDGVQAAIASLTAALDDEDQRAAAVLPLVYVTKALLMAGDAAGSDLLTVLLDRLRDDAIGARVADAFGLLLSDEQGVLCSGSAARQRLLYKQRVFVTALPALVAVLDDRDGTGREVRSNHVVSAVSLMSHMPRQVIVDHIEVLMPLIVQAVQARDEAQKVVGARTLASMMESIVDLVSGHVASLIPALLAMATAGGGVGGGGESGESGEASDEAPYRASARLTALVCLTELTRVPFARLFPFRDRVVVGLQAALDDPKRVVRRAAVIARNEWALVSAAS